MPQRLLALLVLCLFSAVAVADPLLQLHQVQLTTQGSLGDLYRLYADPDADTAAAIERHLELAREPLAGLQQVPGEQAQALVTQLLPQWTVYSGMLIEQTRGLQRTGSLEIPQLAELIVRNRQLQSLLQRLDASLVSSGETPISPITLRARSLSLAMQEIANSYLARSIGAHALGVEEPALNELADRFSRDLAQLQQETRAYPHYQQSLIRLTRQWQYIEPPIQRFQEASLPFVVQQYSARIVTELERLAASEP